MAESTQYAVELPPQLYTDVREFLARADASESRSVDRFVQEAVDEYLLQEAERRIHAANSDLSEEEVLAMVDEALQEVRGRK